MEHGGLPSGKLFFYITMEHHHVYWGKIHYFEGHGFNSTLVVITRGYLWISARISPGDLLRFYPVKLGDFPILLAKNRGDFTHHHRDLMVVISWG